MLRNLLFLLLIPWCLLASGVTVLPTQGRAGDDFNFQVKLTPVQERIYENIFLRIYDTSGDYYDYQMKRSGSDTYTLTLSIDEPSVRKRFIVGYQDLHSQIVWQQRDSFFRVIEDDEDSDTLSEDSATRFEAFYIKQVMENVLICLHHKRGYTVWNGKRYYGCWVRGRNTYCARFVRMCFGESKKYGTAIEMYRHYKGEDLIVKKGTPPKGAVVFYATRSGMGHVGIADGTGGLFSAASYVKGIKHDMTFTAKAKYLGYVTPLNFKEFY